MYQRADIFTGNDLLQVAHGIHVEDDDGQVVFLAHAGGGEVHHLQPACQHFVVRDIVKLLGGRVFFGVGGIDAVYARAFQHHVGFYFDASQR